MNKVDIEFIRNIVGISYIIKMENYCEFNFFILFLNSVAMYFFLVLPPSIV